MHFVVLCECDCLFNSYSPPRLDTSRGSSVQCGLHKIQLESTKHLNSIFWSICIQITHPEIYCIERVLICQIKTYESSTDFIIVHPCYLSESLLTCRIPDKHPYLTCWQKIFTFRVTIAELDLLDFEVPRKCGLSSMIVEHVLNIPLYKACFANHWLSDADDFKLLWFCGLWISWIAAYDAFRRTSAHMSCRSPFHRIEVW